MSVCQSFALKQLIVNTSYQSSQRGWRHQTKLQSPKQEIAYVNFFPKRLSLFHIIREGGGLKGKVQVFLKQSEQIMPKGKIKSSGNLKHNKKCINII